MIWILRYLWGFVDTCLEFGKGNGGLIGFVDSDYSSDLNKRSLTRFVFCLGKCVLSWKSTLQATVALSITEVEYMVLTKAIKEAIWLRDLYNKLNLDSLPTNVFCDSQSAIYLTKDQMFHGKMKHINMKYHFVWDVVSRGNIIVKKIGTKDNPTDMLTKPPPITKFKHCLSLICVHNLKW